MTENTTTETENNKCNRNQPNIIKYCMFKETQKAGYNKLRTGGNDPKLSNAMRYSQIIQKNTRR